MTQVSRQERPVAIARPELVPAPPPAPVASAATPRTVIPIPTLPTVSHSRRLEPVVRQSQQTAQLPVVPRRLAKGTNPPAAPVANDSAPVRPTAPLLPATSGLRPRG